MPLNVKKFGIFSLFILTDAAYLVKYGMRVSVEVVVGLLLLWLPFKWFVFSRLVFKNSEVPKWLIAAFIIVLVLVGTLLLFQINPAQTHVDRWDAIVYWWQAVFEGNFPYSARTRFGGFLSPFPFLQACFLPFYLLGEIGILTLLAPLILIFYLTKIDIKYHKLTLVVFCLATAPSLYWEIAVRSTLWFNGLLLLLILFSITTNTRRDFTFMFVLGILAGLVLSSRMVLLLPYTALIVYDYKAHKSLLQTCWLTVGIGLGFIATWLPLLVVFPLNNFISHNPFLHHNNHMPVVASFTFVFISFYIGWTSTTSAYLIRSCGVLLMTLVPVFLAVEIHKHGFEAAMLLPYGSGDISYVNLSFPLLLYSISNIFNTDESTNISRRSGHPN